MSTTDLELISTPLTDEELVWNAEHVFLELDKEEDRNSKLS